MTWLRRKRSTPERPMIIPTFSLDNATPTSSSARKTAASRSIMAGSMRLWRDRLTQPVHVNILRETRGGRDRLDRISRGAGSGENRAAHTLGSIGRRASRAPIPAAQHGASVAPAGTPRLPGHPGRSPDRAERPVALRTGPRSARRFPPSHAGQHRSLRLYGGFDRCRNMARHEHRGPAQDPGLRADGPARLRPHLDPEFLAFGGPTGPILAAKSPQTGIGCLH